MCFYRSLNPRGQNLGKQFFIHRRFSIPSDFFGYFHQFSTRRQGLCCGLCLSALFFLLPRCGDLFSKHKSRWSQLVFAIVFVSLNILFLLLRKLHVLYCICSIVFYVNCFIKNVEWCLLIPGSYLLNAFFFLVNCDFSIKGYERFPTFDYILRKLIYANIYKTHEMFKNFRKDG